MRSVLNRRRRGQRGSAFVEGAFVLLMTFTMLLFIIDLGRFLLIQEYIAERVRLTARKAAVNNWTATQVKNFLVYSVADTQVRTTRGPLGLLPSQVTYTPLGTAGTSNNRLQVRVSGVSASLFIPKLYGTRALPTVVATVPAQSLGLTN
jgi:hypothetical protein